jgi:hypothetical protein
MEEIQTREGLITNASFTDYLIPTTLDLPPVESALVDDPEPDAPYGVKRVGEPPTVVSTAAILSALPAAGRSSRVPVRVDDVVGLEPGLPRLPPVRRDRLPSLGERHRPVADCALQLVLDLVLCE